MLQYFKNSTRALQAFQVIRFIAMFAIGVGMARLGFSKEEIGSYEAILFISGLLTTFWITGLIQALLPLYSYQVGDDKTDNRLFNALVVVLALTFVACLMAIVFRGALTDFANLNGNLPFYLMVLYIALSTPSTLTEYVYLLKGKNMLMLTYGFITYGLQVLFVLLPVLLSLGVECSVLGLILISALRFVWMLVVVFRNSTIDFSCMFIKEYLHDGIPLSLKFLVSTSGLYIDQLIIGHYYDSSTFAIYRFGAREIPLYTILTVSLSNSMLANFGRGDHLPKILNTIKVESRRLSHILFPISILAVLSSKLLFGFIFGDAFKDSAGVFMIYSLIVVSRVLMPQTIAQGLRKNGAVLTISIIEMLLNIGLSLLLINRYGIYGVALATVVVYLIEKILLIIYNRVRLKIPASAYVPFDVIVPYSFILIAAFLLSWLLF
ncbi:oligosaccharide flippase family protein [Tenuifilum thalassicum]|uniref:Oligosaccharide flippase family protein n=1 Tax=Tenuifilum thalassicum TaxID=2590900 RepID=A0A7D3XK60_9BACT|nr:oligosaccharide flippase family protein [Tenuifilum thalassicum]QKG79195.1 oligosaccharide flippase family protein [Tenuifilum thalassicum]